MWYHSMWYHLDNQGDIRLIPTWSIEQSPPRTYIEPCKVHKYEIYF